MTEAPAAPIHPAEASAEDAAVFTIGDAIHPSFGGFGVQLNQNVYADLTYAYFSKPTPPPGAPRKQSGVTQEEFEASWADLEQKTLLLAPQLVRIFFNEAQDSAPGGSTGLFRDSFIRTVRLADQAGATINITWQSGSVWHDPVTPYASMAYFAAVIAELVKTHGITNLRWVTLQNEPNTPGLVSITPPKLEVLYGYLRSQLDGMGITREQVRFMGGDLVQGDDCPAPSSQKTWVEYMHEHMSETLDAYSFHIYWHVNEDDRNKEDMPTSFAQTADTKMWQRLQGIKTMVDALKPVKPTKPLFVTEYGANCYSQPAAGKKPQFEYTTEAGKQVRIEQSLCAAFQHAWFQIVAAQLGFTGTIKWDCAYGMYDGSEQSFSAIGPPAGPNSADLRWPLYPTYFLLWLFANAAEPGWSIAEVKPTSATQKQQLAALRHGAELAILGLDSSGVDAKGAMVKPVPAASYRIATGLGGSRKLTLIVWNRNGEGRLDHTELPTDSHGVVTVRVPASAVFALTTRAVTMPPRAPSAPGAPTGVHAVAGEARATVWFDAPASDGGAKITGYTVVASPGPVSASGVSSPIVVTGLTPGQPYTFTVAASNFVTVTGERGTGPTSHASDPVTPAPTAPAAPTGVTAEERNGSVAVSFTAPGYDGGAEVTGYTVTATGYTVTPPPAGSPPGTPDIAVALPADPPVSGDSSPIAVPGLAPGVPYTFTVTATNAAGIGPASAPSSPMPAPPTVVSADAKTQPGSS